MDYTNRTPFIDEECKTLILLSMINTCQYLGQFIGYYSDSPAGIFYNHIRTLFSLADREDAIIMRLIEKEGEEIIKISINQPVLNALGKRLSSNSQREYCKSIFKDFTEKWLEHPDIAGVGFLFLGEYIKAVKLYI